MQLRTIPRIDPIKGAQGRWVSLHEFGDLEVRVAYFNCSEAESLRIDLMSTLAGAIQMGGSQRKAAVENIAIQVAANVLTRDWRNLHDGDEEIPYSAERAVAIFTDYPLLRERVEAEAQRLGPYKLEEDASAGKPSAP